MKSPEFGAYYALRISIATHLSLPQDQVWSRLVPRVDGASRCPTFAHSVRRPSSVCGVMSVIGAFLPGELRGARRQIEKDGAREKKSGCTCRSDACETRPASLLRDQQHQGALLVHPGAQLWLPWAPERLSFLCPRQLPNLTTLHPVPSHLLPPIICQIQC
jgi:hypothetical protein